MSFRDFLAECEKANLVRHVKEEKDPNLEIPKILSENAGQILQFEKVKGSSMPVVAGVCSKREYFAKAIGCEKNNLIQKISNAIANPTKPKVVETGACQEVVDENPDLSKIPILTHTSKDLGAYVTSGVYASKNKAGRLNIAYHRSSPIAKDKFVARICHRDTWKNLEENGGELDVAICLGLDPTVLLAASVSAGDTCEYDIANTLKPLELVKCKTSDLLVPAEAEIVIEATLTSKERHEEGPFADITGTLDSIRQEPVVKVKCITHRKNPIYQALLPASNEHRLLMG
ncbi:MAG TPA: UbiD family decarboxylase, partial [Candidatus Altiarchaeales archaeon]|nr:UbiD family decarboxylase [Candidatus Altiarchaeales archaeon]